MFLRKANSDTTYFNSTFNENLHTAYTRSQPETVFMARGFDLDLCLSKISSQGFVYLVGASTQIFVRSEVRYPKSIHYFPPSAETFVKNVSTTLNQILLTGFNFPSLDTLSWVSVSVCLFTRLTQPHSSSLSVGIHHQTRWRHQVSINALVDPEVDCHTDVDCFQPPTKKFFQKSPTILNRKLSSDFCIPLNSCSSWVFTIRISVRPGFIRNNRWLQCWLPYRDLFFSTIYQYSSRNLLQLPTRFFLRHSAAHLWTPFYEFRFFGRPSSTAQHLSIRQHG